MKLHSLLATLLFGFCLCLPARAQSNAKEAADILRALNIQIGQAQTAGDKERVLQLQKRYEQVQKKWNVQPTGSNLPPPAQRPPVQQPVKQPANPPAQPAVAGDSEEAKAIALTNSERQKRGLKNLVTDPKLTAAARGHSNDMVRLNFFSHTSPVSGKEQLTQRAAKVGTTANAENVAQGQATAAEVMNSWMNSAGHKMNILRPTATRIGVGKSGVTWTMVIGD